MTPEGKKDTVGFRMKKSTLLAIFWIVIAASLAFTGGFSLSPSHSTTTQTLTTTATHTLRIATSINGNYSLISGTTVSQPTGSYVQGIDFLTLALLMIVATGAGVIFGKMRL